jgi:uncharacterized protein YgiM (DUF1202 family)
LLRVRVDGKLGGNVEITMRLPSLVSATWAATCAIMLLGGPASADTGDALIVTGDGVNVRAGPSGDAAIRMRVNHDQQVIELQREGSWVRAEIAGTDGQEGWIHSSLLTKPGEQAELEGGAPAEPEPAETGAPAVAVEKRAPAAAEVSAKQQANPLLVEPAAGPEGDVSELARFRETVSYLNERAVALAGADLFADVKSGPGGEMRVIATDAWSNVSPAGRQSYANTLLDRWAATKVSAGPAVLQIVDPSGEVVMEKTQP